MAATTLALLILTLSSARLTHGHETASAFPGMEHAAEAIQPPVAAFGRGEVRARPGGGLFLFELLFELPDEPFPRLIGRQPEEQELRISWSRPGCVPPQDTDEGIEEHAPGLSLLLLVMARHGWSALSESGSQGPSGCAHLQGMPSNPKQGVSCTGFSPRYQMLQMPEHDLVLLGVSCESESDSELDRGTFFPHGRCSMGVSADPRSGQPQAALKLNQLVLASQALTMEPPVKAADPQIISAALQQDRNAGTQAPHQIPTAHNQGLWGGCTWGASL